MEKYIFIFGNWPKISLKELEKAPNINLNKAEALGEGFALAQSAKNPQEILDKLGGTIKIGRFLEKIDNLSQLKKEKWLNWLLANTTNPSEKKINFSFSLYSGNKKEYQLLDILAKEIKKELKNQNYKARYVSSQKSVLSSVIVKKNNLLGKELLIIKEKNSYFLGLTEAVQDFAAYSLRDWQRPSRDDHSGMLPPKLAQMMINLSGSKNTKNILDPFCGSGTVLQEALLLGFRQIYGTDISSRAIEASEKNLLWLKSQKNIQAKIEIKKADVCNLDKIFTPNSIDLIVTEPFMGDARFIQRQNNITSLEKTKTDLQELYLTAFSQFRKILKKEGKIIFVFPLFNLGQKKLNTLDIKTITHLGFVCQSADLLYNRDKQKVERQITIWQKSN